MKKRKHTQSNWGGAGSNARARVRKYFPQVEEVVDADQDIIVEVTAKDNKDAARLDHSGCAMSVACKRAHKADGVITAVKTMYVIKGKKAFRYMVPEAVSREVISYDRNGEFEPGVYKLNQPRAGQRLGEHTKHPHGNTGEGRKIEFTHHTGNIRTVLGSKNG